MDKIGALKQTLQQAELKAKRRTEIDLGKVNDEEAKANEQGFMIVRKRQRAVNQTRFSQTIDENIAYLCQIQYLTSAEFSFIFTLAPMLKMNVNAIVDPTSGQYCSVSEIATYLKRSRQKTSEMISALIEKGIMYEFANVHELKIYGRHVTRRPFFLNPEIICCGDKNRLQSGIVQLMIHYNILERSGVKLPIKAIVEPHSQYGKLVKRKKFLEVVKKQKGK
ncbi:hypothetical protein RW092_09840 [Paenibacillus sp. 3LSP]|jgi:hypothetical protein|uniref:hypothetical protein n=1 Tax=unclassified Paenibacillus TaxID=185978 RepID=UPI00089C4EE1|nr:MULTISPECIES: hypothetical protein [unclassified Paenibacillus]MDU0330504.1 hypothetical protein [Paenibacillus sp. 3LSP]SDX28838.1 hypothetical protein SAMN05518848_10623 [Paenibacillus sp. PDC88]